MQSALSRASHQAPTALSQQLVIFFNNSDTQTTAKKTAIFALSSAMSSANTSQLLALLAIQPREIPRKERREDLNIQIDVQTKSDVLKILGYPYGLKAVSLKALCTRAGIEGKSSLYLLAEVQAKVSNAQVMAKAVAVAAHRISQNHRYRYLPRKQTARKTGYKDRWPWLDSRGYLLRLRLPPPPPPPPPPLGMSTKGHSDTQS
jgi:hypothetical protein